MQIRRVLVLFFVFSTFLRMSFCHDGVHAQDGESARAFHKALISEIQGSVVLIGQARKPSEGGNLILQHTIATGFLVDQRNTVATARSRFTKYVDKERLVVKFRSPTDRGKFRVLPARILYEFPNKDLAFLRVEGAPSDLAGLSRLTLIETVAEIESLTAETVIVAGHPLLGNFDRAYPVLRRGMISSTDHLMNGPPLILLDLVSITGFSGAPVVVERTGRVIGMIPGAESAKGWQGFQWAIPVTGEDYRRAISTMVPSE